MSEMVERVAKAIALAGNGGDWDDRTFYQDEHKEFHRKRARAAIEAMREPTDAMVSYVVTWGPDGLGDGCREVWSDMINEALK